MPEQATFVTLDNLVNGWRQRFLFYIDTSIWGRIWDVADFAINISICIVYIINTTYVDSNKGPAKIPDTNRNIEFMLALVFLVQYFVRFVIINTNHRTMEHIVVFFAFVSQ
ncbi:hypothetical protein BX661DRAFT_27621 [Kickxella alabastrina]|uniref:uncharacterized protein n=1 Tax=Kickxella alabastrina TaxID=61397 RepID=UPI00221FD352|nr:uncharacterized protein BX661DRAFT_27621 [Kickxella alabastrina]KAI7826638.1 hypothetical protein BX661DRAFT_27621 [Kickxella alabastrina]